MISLARRIVGSDLDRIAGDNKTEVAVLALTNTTIFLASLAANSGSEKHQQTALPFSRRHQLVCNALIRILGRLQLFARSMPDQSCNSRCNLCQVPPWQFVHEFKVET